MTTPESFWRRCSSCKREIRFEVPYWTCSVSTCNRKGSSFVFCSVACWNALSDEDVRFAARHRRIVVVEDHNPKTGLGTWLQVRLSDLGLVPRVRKLGVTGYASSGPAKELYRMMGLDGASIARAVREERVR